MDMAPFRQPKPLSSLWWCCLVFAAVIAQTASSAPASADEGVQIVIRLEEGRFYSAAELHRQCREKLPGNDLLEPNDDSRRELTAAERAALLLAAEIGWVRVEFEPDRLSLWLPNSEDPEVRLRNRRRVGRWLNLPLEAWPANKGLHLPQLFDPRATSVVLIHGLESDLTALDRMAGACQSVGVQVLRFDYPNDGPLAWSGDRLSEDLKRLIAKHPMFRSAIIAHSMGGLVARYCLETPGKNPACVTDLVLLGAPNQGAETAQLQADLEVMYSLLPGGVDQTARLLDGFGEAVEDLRPGSAFLGKLNSQSRPVGVRYHVAIGRKSFLNDDQRQVLLQQFTRFKRDAQASSSRIHRLLRWLKSDAMQNGRGDGAVSITSARLPGVAGQEIFTLDHLELLYLTPERPAESEVFRWVAKQLHWPMQE